MIDLSDWLWPGAGLGLIDGFTRPWWVFSIALWLLVGAFSVFSQAADEKAGRYWLFFGLCFAGNMLLIAAQDALSFYLGFSLMSLAAYGLVIHNRSPAARRAARLYLQLAILGELLLFSGLLLRASAAQGQFDWHSWQQVPLEPLTLVLLLLGLGLKAGFWPLHVWLPQAHPVAPAPASALLSGVMIKAGLLGLLMFLPASDSLLISWAPFLLILGIVSAFYGAIAGLLQSAPKVILAYSSVSQMGYLLLLFALVSISGVNALPVLVLYVLHHGMAKAGLFLYAGMATEAVEHKGRQGLFWLAALSLMALPLSSGALVKTGLKSQLALAQLPGWLNYGWLSVLLSLGAVLTALLLLHLAAKLRQATVGLVPAKASLGQTGRWLLLGLLITALWLLPWWAMAAFLLPMPVMSELLALLLPLMLAIFIYAGWHSQYLQGVKKRLPVYCYNRITPAVYWSLWIKRQYQPLTKASSRPQAIETNKKPLWRRVERRVNRGPGWTLLPVTAGVLCVLFSLALLLQLA